MTRKKAVPMRHRFFSVEKYTAFKNRFYKHVFRADYWGDELNRSSSNHEVIMLSNLYPIDGVKLEMYFDMEDD